MGLGTQCKPITFQIRCPKCDSYRELANSRLYEMKPRYINCKLCKASITSSRWKCMCDIPWLECTTHRSQGFRCGKERRHSNTFRLNMHVYSYTRFKQNSRTKRLNKVWPLRSDMLGLPAIHLNPGKIKEPYVATGRDGRTQKRLKKRRSVHHACLHSIRATRLFLDKPINLAALILLAPGGFSIKPSRSKAAVAAAFQVIVIMLSKLRHHKMGPCI